jgi:hypothetical protein
MSQEFRLNATNGFLRILPSGAEHLRRLEQPVDLVGLRGPVLDRGFVGEAQGCPRTRGGSACHRWR